MRLVRRSSVVLVLLVCLPLLAQKFTGTIRGTVTGPSGKLVSGAEVIAVNSATGQSRTVSTGKQGTYVMPGLPPGIYEVHVKQEKLQDGLAKGVMVHVSAETVVNLGLRGGAETEQSSVEVPAIQVETVSGALDNIVDTNQIVGLPLNGRNFLPLTQLMPGVSPSASFNATDKGLFGNVDFSVNGNSVTGNVFTVDGVKDNDVASNRALLVYPSIDAIQEFNVLRNSYGPEFGQAMGAVVNIVTRRGTDEIHGGAFYFGRNDKLNATDWFNRLNGTPKDVLRRNDFGYNLGGPAFKDKLFLFWSQEWNREIRGQLRTANVPTVAEKAGDFSNLRMGCEARPTDPASPDPNNPTVLTSVAQGQALHPGFGLSRGGQDIVSLFPDPNVANPVGCQNWAQSLSTPVYWRQEDLRLDYRMGPTWTLMGRFTQDLWSQPFPSTLSLGGDDRYPSVESRWRAPARQATLKLSKAFGRSAVNDFQIAWATNRAQADRAGSNPTLNDQIRVDIPTFFPLAGKFAGDHIGYPTFLGGLGNGADSDNLLTQAPWHSSQETYVLTDNFSKVIRSHTFKVGVLYSLNKHDQLVNGASGEAPAFSSMAVDPAIVTPTAAPAVQGSTGNGVFDALWAGRIRSFSELRTNPFSQTRWRDIEAYLGDTWKLRPNLTLEYGARWSLLRMPYSAVDRIASFQASAYDPAFGSDPCNGLWLPPGSSACSAAGFSAGASGPNRALKTQNGHAVAPRLGIAWDPTGNGKTSIRAGAGQFFQRERLSNSLLMANTPPFAVSVSGFRDFEAAPASNTLTASGTPGVSVDPGSDLPNTWQWNLTVERELYRDTKVEVSYVGNRGTHLLRYNDANPIPGGLRLDYALTGDNIDRPFGVGDWGFIQQAQWEGSSTYHALQGLVRTHLKGLDAQLAYTWSKSLADTDITQSDGTNAQSLVTNPDNPHQDYGPTSIHRPRILVGNLVYHLPTLSGQSSVMRGVLGGWEVASILAYTSGSPLTVYAGLNPGSGLAGANNLSGTGTNQRNDRPLGVAGQPCRAPAGSLATQWLNPAAFTLDGYVLGSSGNSPVGVCYGPGIANTDLGLHKNFRLTEKIGLQFRLELFNAFNEVQFSANGGSANGINVNLANSAHYCSGNSTLDDPSCAGHTAGTVAFNYATDGQSSFGQVTRDRGPREIQYALKITF